MMKQKSIKLNAALNSIRTVSAVIFPLISIPYVTRVLGNTNYGKVNFAYSIVSYFTLLAALGIPQYTAREGAPLREDKQAFSAFVNEIFSINLISSLLAYLLLACVMLIPGFRSYRLLLVIHSLAILFTTLGTDWINTIYEDFAFVTIRFIAAQLLSLVCLLLFVRSADDYVIYALITVLASSGAYLLNIWHIRRYVRPRFTLKLNLHKHMKPLLLLFANQVAITIYINSDITIMGILKGDEAVGIYTLSSRIYIAVKQVLNAAITVVVPRLAIYAQQQAFEPFKKLLDSLLNFLIALVPPVLVGLFMVSDRAMLLAGGAEYASGYRSLQILSLALLFAVLACFFSNGILLPAKKDSMFLASTIAGAGINIALNMFFIPFFGINGAAITTLLGEMVVFFMVYTSSRQVVRCTVQRAALTASLAECVCIVVICLLCRHLIGSALLSVLASVALCALCYLPILYVFNRPLLDRLFGRFISR